MPDSVPHKSNKDLLQSATCNGDALRTQSEQEICYHLNGNTLLCANYVCKHFLVNSKGFLFVCAPVCELDSFLKKFILLLGLPLLCTKNGLRRLSSRCKSLFLTNLFRTLAELKKKKPIADAAERFVPCPAQLQLLYRGVFHNESPDSRWRSVHPTDHRSDPTPPPQ